MINNRKKITTHDLAVSLGLSRNTVSKALNDHPSVSEATKRKVIETAISMGYKKVKIPDSLDIGESAQTTGTIAFLTTRKETFVDGYWMNVMQGVEEVAGDNRYDIIFNFLRGEDINSLVLPKCVANRTIDGFVVAGNIGKEYNELLFKVKMPKVFIDIHSDMSFSDLKADVVLMENEHSVNRITRHLIELGHKDIGFIGDIGNCRSFMERWLGFKSAMEDANLEIQPKFCAIRENPSSYQDYNDVRKALANMEQLPTAFICANDLIAIQVVKYLSEQNIKVPDEISVCGFDNIKQTELMNLPLTTVLNDEYALGRRAAEELLWRIRNPNSPFELVRVSTRPLFRESTGICRHSTV